MLTKLRVRLSKCVYPHLASAKVVSNKTAKKKSANPFIFKIAILENKIGVIKCVSMLTKRRVRLTKCVYPHLDSAKVVSNKTAKNKSGNPFIFEIAILQKKLKLVFLNV